LLLQHVYQRALDHHQNGRLLEAITDYDTVITHQSNHTQAHNNRGAALAALNRNEEALASFTRAVALDSHNAGMLINLGMALGKLGRYTEALERLNHAVALAPDNADAHHNHGIVLTELDKHSEALQSFEQAIALAPNFVQAHRSRGLALGKLDRFDEKLASYDRVIALAPNFAKAHHERGGALHSLGRHAEAVECFDRASTLDPRVPAPQYSKGMTLLRFGDYEKGLALYELRWQPGAVPREVRQFTQPPWRGEIITDKTLLLHAEQGLGDSLQMLRYLPLVKTKAAHVILDLPKPLHSTLGTIVDGITVIETGQPLPSFDLQCGLMSLPFACSTRLSTIPAQVPYLAAPHERLPKWGARLPRLATPRVGLVWSSGSLNPDSRHRTLALERLAPWLRIPGLTFVSLQVEYREQDLPELSRLPIERLHDAISDFGDTAAAITRCDLVISVDTAVAHLAGALGKPVWVLLPHVADWRWLMDRSDSPWYPTARLFRQSNNGNWGDVITAVAGELSTLSSHWIA
jgi:Tfp pilus assembly protein PilF